LTHTEKIIGREHEKGELRKYFEATRSGNGTIVLITGDAGMGKTALARETLAESRLAVYTGRSTEGAVPPYGPLTSVFRAYHFLKKKSIDCGPLTPYLSFLLPELGTPREQPDANTIVETIVRAISAIAGDGASVIFLDDLHSADNATLSMLPVLAERIENTPLLILGTYRSDEIPRGHHLRKIRNELRRKRMLNEIPLGNLNRGETAGLLERRIGAAPTDSLTDLIYDKTLGVPLFIEELADVLVSNRYLAGTPAGAVLPEGEKLPIPESIRDAVLLRLDGMPESTRELLKAGAAAGLEFDLALLTGIAGSDDSLTELLELNWIIETDPGRGAFKHALLREAVYSDIVWSQRRELHRRIAEYLERQGSAPELIADQWLAADEKLKARKALLESAERSCKIHAYRDAARSAHRALESWREGEDEEMRVQTLERLAHCAQMNGQSNDAVRVLREAAESPLVRNDRRRYAEVQRSLAALYGMMGMWEQCLSAHTASAGAYLEAGDETEAAAELLSAAEQNFGLGNPQAAIDLSNRAFHYAGNAERYDIQARLLALKGHSLCKLENHKEGIETVQSGLSLALEHNLTDAASEAYKRLADALEYGSDFVGAGKAYQSAYTYCVNQGNEILAQFCLGCMSYVLARTGNWKRSVELCTAVINDPKSLPVSLAVAHCMLAFIQAFRGSIRQARKNMKKCLSIARPMNIDSILMGCIEGFALMDEYEGYDASAADRYMQLLAMRDELGDNHMAVPGLCSAVMFFSIRGMDKEAALCSSAIADMAKHSGNAENLGVLAFALGEMSLLQNDPREAVRQFQQAMAHFEKLEIPIEIIKAEFRLGVAYRRIDDRQQAVAHLNNGYHMAKNLGCRPLAAQIGEELDALGEPTEELRSPEAASRAVYNGLTRRQVQIIQLITEGMTNKEIAGKLYLSPRTVEMHVANILDRLNCRSRIEAVRKAEELGVVG
jgi:DNA-binding CsgD family transcriptional regulator